MSRVRFNLPRVKTYAERLPAVLRQPPKHRTHIEKCKPGVLFELNGGPLHGEKVRMQDRATREGSPLTLPLRFRDGKRGVYIYSDGFGKWQPTA